MEDQVEYKKLTDIVTGKKFYMKVESETPEQIVKSQLPYIGRVLFEQMEDDQPEMLKEKMKNPELFIEEMWRLSNIYTNKASSLIDCGMNYLEAMAEARQTVAAIVGL
jgi:hypothetical protein